MNDHGPRYFEDYLLGTTYECGTISFDEASIINFAKKFDPQPFHANPVAAASGPFGGLIASGWHTAALTMRAAGRELPRGGGQPRRRRRGRNPLALSSAPGDTLRVRATVVESRRSLSKPDRGIIKTLAEAANQDGRTVMRCTAINFLRVRPAPAA